MPLAVAFGSLVESAMTRWKDKITGSIDEQQLSFGAGLAEENKVSVIDAWNAEILLGLSRSVICASFGQMSIHFTAKGVVCVVLAGGMLTCIAMHAAAASLLQATSASI